MALTESVDGDIIKFSRDKTVQPPSNVKVEKSAFPPSGDDASMVVEPTLSSVGSSSELTVLRYSPSTQIDDPDSHGEGDRWMVM